MRVQVRLLFRVQNINIMKEKTNIGKVLSEEEIMKYLISINNNKGHNGD